MTATVTQIWSGNTNPSNIDQTATFSNADFLFFMANGVPAGDEFEIAGSLTVDIVGTEDIGGFPVPTAYGTKEIPLPIPVFDTAQVVRIPGELAHTALNLRLHLATTYAVDLTIYAVSSGVTLQGVQQELEALRERFEEEADKPPLTFDDIQLIIDGVALLL